MGTKQTVCQFYVFFIYYVGVFLEEKGVEASVDGVLGGYGHVNEADVKGSEAFLKTLLGERFFDGGKSRHLVALGTISFSSHKTYTHTHSISFCYCLSCIYICDILHYIMHWIRRGYIEYRAA